MTTEQPLALKLADELDWQTHWKDHAAELRRQHAEIEALRAAVTKLRAAIEDALAATYVKIPITDDHGKATTHQFRVIEQRGKWQLLADIHVLGNTAHHEFRIRKLAHDIILYPGIPLAKAKKLFDEKMENDNE
jgi:hypothetical protein